MLLILFNQGGQGAPPVPMTVDGVFHAQEMGIRFVSGEDGLLFLSSEDGKQFVSTEESNT